MHIKQINQPKDLLKENMYSLFQEVSSIYPDFHEWLEKIILEVSSKKRIIYVAFDRKTPVGIIIIKNSLLEAKICTLYIKEEYQKKNIGSQLISISKGILKGRLVSIHMTENTFYKYAYFFSKQGFNILYVEEGKYKKKQREYNLFSQF